MRALALSSLLVLLTACPSSPDATVAPTTATVEDQPDQPDRAASSEPGLRPCAALDTAEVANAAAEQGMRKLEESRDGEHYRTGPFEEAMVSLRIAAEHGHRGAQSLYGRTMFEVRFLAQAPVPEERDDYVAAFTFLRIAALRGDPAVDGYLPGLADPQPLVTAEPLSQLPADWLTEAWAAADDWMACHGSAVADRGVQ